MQKPSPNLARGFSLLEMVISLSVLLLVMGTIFEQITLMQRKAVSESNKIDLMQQSREFVDQAVRDLHMAGYPSQQMYSPLMNDESKIARGLMSASPTQIVVQGDVNGDGNVEILTLSYIDTDPADPACPCVRRSAVEKVNADPQLQPQAANFTEIQHVVPPQPSTPIFSFYDANGNSIDATSDSHPAISTVKMNLSVFDGTNPASGHARTSSFSATARLDQ
jgi:prepilin-type N-terminal cleavage/methylation domain-containing protein